MNDYSTYCIDHQSRLAKLQKFATASAERHQTTVGARLIRNNQNVALITYSAYFTYANGKKTLEGVLTSISQVKC